MVSACHDSVVCVWSIEHGEKIIQFSNAHGDSEITAMTFDQSKRRLITGARDGTVKIWNFNNGCCLRELEPIDDEEVNKAPETRLIFSAILRATHFHRVSTSAMLQAVIQKRLKN